LNCLFFGEVNHGFDCFYLIKLFVLKFVVFLKSKAKEKEIKLPPTWKSFPHLKVKTISFPVAIIFFFIMIRSFNQELYPVEMRNKLSLHSPTNILSISKKKFESYAT